MSLPAPAEDVDVVVTGASSGIGAELARVLARRGHNLVLVARREDRMRKLADQLRTTHDVAAEVIGCDLAARADRVALVDRIRSRSRVIGGVCNCAGFGTSGSFARLPLAREREEVEVNVVALLELTHAFLPGMVAAGRGAVLNVASLAGFQPMPGMATYSATKAFVLTFSEAVHQELRGSGVSCTTLCPGPVDTEWATIAGVETAVLPAAKVGVERVAEEAVAAMEQGKRVVVPGMVPKTLANASRVAPHSVLLPMLSFARRMRG
ncbi:MULTISPECIES: SDR family oxidoreductase [Thermocrispum]|jgi:hypothetical protein|uniref:SDR family oxidoreductase n=1 Tax=Thermocrispum agreste TaxID=37925 RepID=A0ABD6FL53_9PSEU|nr:MULTISPECIES: SDR family oxidoreductase [Thermocrispum]